MADERQNWNQKIIDEFHENAGKVGAPFEGIPLLLLHTTGARTGAERVNPLAYQPVDGSFVVFASKGGAPANPDWFHNLRAHPDVTVEVGTDTLPVRARVATGEERERIWTRQKERHPAFADYEQKTSREIPVVVLERR
jgi:deazaflavin-dependent oxidoreductase (nitroreductase family)